jgi:alpha-beta hydrolase superfamily lysophospholipase
MPFINRPNSRGKIYYRIWDIDSLKANLVFSHGVGEHSGLYHRLAHSLNPQGFKVWAIDHVAHGHTTGSLEELYGISSAVDDFGELVKLARTDAPNLSLFIVGHSLGGVIASLLLCGADAPAVNGVVLTGTPLEAPSEVGPDAVMSEDPEYLDALDVDALIPEIDFSKFDDGMTQAHEVIWDNIGLWKHPVLFINGEFDPIAPPHRVKEWAKKVPNADAIEVKGAHHDLLNDLCHAEVSKIISSFLSKC